LRIEPFESSEDGSFVANQPLALDLFEARILRGGTAVSMGVGGLATVEVAHFELDFFLDSQLSFFYYWLVYFQQRHDLLYFDPLGVSLP
jgi:hypothetical protein